LEYEGYKSYSAVREETINVRKRAGIKKFLIFAIIIKHRIFYADKICKYTYAQINMHFWNAFSTRQISAAILLPNLFSKKIYNCREFDV